MASRLTARPVPLAPIPLAMKKQQNNLNSQIPIIIRFVQNKCVWQKQISKAAVDDR